MAILDFAACDKNVLAIVEFEGREVLVIVSRGFDGYRLNVPGVPCSVEVAIEKTFGSGGMSGLYRLAMG